MIDGVSYPLIDPVWQHFRSMRNLDRLFGKPALQIFAEPFSHSTRRGYFARALDTLLTLEGHRLVLLDPDTGIAPSKANEKHIRIEECAEVWRVLKPGDLLLLYQHSWRETAWREGTRKKIQEVIGDSKLIVVESNDIASDVILLGAAK